MSEPPARPPEDERPTGLVGLISRGFEQVFALLGRLLAGLLGGIFGALLSPVKGPPEGEE